MLAAPPPQVSRPGTQGRLDLERGTFNDQHLGVVTTATSFITTAQKDPEELRSSVCLVVSRLSRIMILASTNLQDYYYFMPAPWLSNEIAAAAAVVPRARRASSAWLPDRVPGDYLQTKCRSCPSPRRCSTQMLETRCSLRPTASSSTTTESPTFWCMPATSWACSWFLQH